ncbi:MAG: helix-turn-helix domain-containing protein [Albidovulum sp.]
MSLKRRKNAVPNPHCPLSACMALIGAAWTPNAIWYLSGGPRRFSELKSDMAPVSAKMLSQRLREMEENRLVIRRVVPTSPPSVEYELTPLGLELLPAIKAIAAVGMKLKEQAAPAPA